MPKSQNRRSLPVRYGISVIAVFGAVFLTLLIRFVFPLNPTPLILIAVIVAAWFGGKYPGLLACLLSDFAIDFFFEEPPYQLNLSTVHIVRLVILGVISLLASARKNAEDDLRIRQQQQAVIAELGQHALSGVQLQQLFEKATYSVNQTLGTDCCAIYKVLPTENKLRFEAGNGWNENVRQHEIDFSTNNSMAGFVLNSEQPVAVENFKKEFRFNPSNIILEHNLQSALGVVIKLRNGNFGVLGAFNRKTRSFSQDDFNFLLAIANVLAEAAERMLSEEIVQEQREWLRTTLASIGDGVIATDKNGFVTFMNPVAENLTGWNEREAKDRQLKEVFHIIDEENQKEVENPVAKVIREGLVVGLANHTVLISKEKRRIPIDDSAAPIKDENGNINGVVLVFQDISERKQAENAKQFLADAAGVMASSLNLKAILNNLADLPVPKIADLCVIDLVNEKNGIQRLTVSHADPSLKNLAEAVMQCTDFDSTAQKGIPNVLRSGKSEFYAGDSEDISAELICGNKDKTDIQEYNLNSVMIVPLIAHGRNLGVISLLLTDTNRRFRESDLNLMEDFAARAALAIDNARLYETVQEANRIKDEFLATLSHELRTPLNAILGWATLLRASKLPPESIESALETIERNAKLQKQIVEDVLDVSGIITGKFRLEIQPVDFISVIESAIETVRPSAMAKDINIIFSPEFIPSKIPGDAGRLQQAMWNLLSNAVKFTPKGGRIEISLSLVDSNLQIKVKDTGQGIDADFLPFVFDRFKQADSSRTRTHGGLGLGLAIVRYIVEMHGGEVKAESCGENSGSTFIINLPIVSVYGKEESLAETGNEFVLKQENEVKNGLKNLRILLIEDEPDSRLMILTILEQQGAIVKAVASGFEGLESLQSVKPDLLISDIGMPEMDGYDLIRKVRALNYNEAASVSAIALTAYAREEDRTQALNAGYQMHLAKPIDPVELVSAIKTLISS